MQIENEKQHFSIWIFRSEEKSYLMRSDFDDFRAAFFDLAFSIATSHRNGGDFRSEKLAIKKYCATRYQGASIAHSQKPTENTRDATTHTPEEEHKGSDHESTQEHPKTCKLTLVWIILLFTCMHSSVAVATTDGCCFTILLSPDCRAAVRDLF